MPRDVWLVEEDTFGVSENKKLLELKKVHEIKFGAVGGTLKGAL